MGQNITCKTTNSQCDSMLFKNGKNKWLKPAPNPHNDKKEITVKISSIEMSNMQCLSADSVNDVTMANTSKNVATSKLSVNSNSNEFQSEDLDLVQDINEDLSFLGKKNCQNDGDEVEEPFDS